MAVVTNAALPERWVSLARLLRKPEARGEGRDDDHAGDAGGAPETCVSGACGRSVSPAPKCPIYRPDRHRPAGILANPSRMGYEPVESSGTAPAVPGWRRSPAGGGDRRAGPTFGSGSHFEEHRLARTRARGVGAGRTEPHVYPSSCGSRLPSTDGTPLCAARGEELADGALHCLLECCQLTDGKRTDRRAGKVDRA